MDALYQRLKELDRDSFEKLCFQILKEKHPGLAPKHVEGAGGDEGLDVFSGELSSEPTIWQCKSFPNGVGKAQKKQIRESLKTALRHFKPSNWILCLSVDMDSKAHRWFEKLKRSYAPRVKIGAFPASEIVHELIHRRSIRTHFFPGVEIDTLELKRLVARTGELSLQQLEAITDNNLEDLIERMKERDARFNYQIVADGDLGPPAINRSPVPGLVLSVFTGAKTVNLFARDVDALRSNPPTFRLSFKGAGVKKYLAMLRTGATQEFASEEFGPLTSEVPILARFAESHGPGAKLTLGPSLELTNRKRSVRVTFRKPGRESVEYALMELRPTRAGTEEAEFVCSGDHLPFEIAVVFSPNMVLAKPRDGKDDAAVLPTSTITFHHFKFEGEDVKQVKKFLDAMILLQPAGEIEIFDLKEEKTFLAAKVETKKDNKAQLAFHRFVSDLAQISDRFKLNLRTPVNFSEEDLESIFILKMYSQGGTLPVENISATIVKSDSNRDLVPQALASGGGRFRFVHPRHNPMPKLLGRVINTGPCAMEVEAKIADLSTVLREFQKAAIGEGVSISFKPQGPVRLSLLSAEEFEQ